MSLSVGRGLILLSFLLGLFSLSQVQAQQYYLDLSHQSLSLPSRTVSVTQVVDGRPGKPVIGLVYRGLANQQAAVLFRRGLEVELTDFLRQQLPARPEDHTVVLCLRQLRVGEQMAGITEKASADLAADVYEQLPDGYHFVRSVAAHTSSRALETTYLHAAHVAQLLQKCLEQLTTYHWPTTPLSPARTLAQMLTDSPMAIPAANVAAGVAQAARPAILQEAPRPGVYYSFGQFLANTPAPGLRATADTVSFGFGAPLARRLWRGVPRLRVRILNEKNQSQSAKEVWGFSDGRQLFVQHEKEFFPLHRYHDFFTFVGETPPDVAYMQSRAQSSAAVMGGVVGAMIASNPNNANDHTAEPMGYSVDMHTGQAGQFPNPLLPPPVRNDTAYIYLYRYADTAAAPVSFSLDDQPAGQLKIREYLEILWPYPGRMLCLCLELPGLPCQLIIPNPAGLNYLRVTTPGSLTTRPICEWVSTAQGEADLDEIDRQRAQAPR